MSRPWMFDMSVKCPFCGAHDLKYSNMTCPKFGETLNEKYFTILKFTELEYRIKELENNEKEKKYESDRGIKKLPPILF